MQTKTWSHTRQMPNRLTRFALGMVVLMLTLLLIVTAIDPLMDDLLVDERCATAAALSHDSFSAETAVPDCWLVQ